MTSRLPDFLIIGAMKAGTTSLFRDLLVHPQVFMPADKEPANLIDDDVLAGEGRAAYERLFAGARADQKCGEASTAYTKLPDLTGAAERAGTLMGDDLRVIYLVREPVSRVISHHYHGVAARQILETDINEAVRTVPSLLDYTRYAMQVQPWIDALGGDNVTIVRSEDYRAARVRTVEMLTRFIGLDPRTDLVRTDVVYNKSDGKPVPEGFFGAVRRSRLYRSVVRPLLPVEAKERLRTALLPSADERPAAPAPETVRYIMDELAEDTRALAGLMGIEGPVWPDPPSDAEDAAGAARSDDSSRRDRVRPKNPQP